MPSHRVLFQNGVVTRRCAHGDEEDITLFVTNTRKERCDDVIKDTVRAMDSGSEKMLPTI